MNEKTSQRTNPHPETEISIEHMVMRRLYELLRPLDRPSKLIRFPVVFGRICPILCLSKKQAWRVLHRLEETGRIKIVPFQGVRLLAPLPTLQPHPVVDAASREPPAEVTAARKSVLAYLKRTGEAYPSDIAAALDLDIDIVFRVARLLLREGRVEIRDGHESSKLGSLCRRVVHGDEAPFPTGLGCAAVVPGRRACTGSTCHEEV